MPLKAENHENKSGDSKLKMFFFGYSRSRSQQIVYLIKRLFWLLIVCSAVRYWCSLIYGLCVVGEFTSLGMLFPAIVATGIGILFCNFD